MKYSEITFSEIDLILNNMEEKYVNKVPSKLRQFIKYKRFGLYTSLCILQQNYTIINKMV